MKSSEDRVVDQGIVTKISISGSAIFGALAAIIALLPLSFPFPIIPYLKFDLAEIPVIIGFLLYGPIPGLVASGAYWIILNFVGSDQPIGPLMKFVATVTTVIGMSLGVKIYTRLFPQRSVRGFIVVTVVTGIVVRVLATTFSNFVVLYYLFPNFLEFAAASVSIALGINLPNLVSALLLILLMTAFYNILHTLLSALPSFTVVNSILGRGIGFHLGEPWLSRAVKYPSRERGDTIT